MLRVQFRLDGDGRVLRAMLQCVDEQVVEHDVAFLDVEIYLLDACVSL